MPFGEYNTWDACIEDQTSKGHSKESSEKICGSIKHKVEDTQKTDDCPCESIQLIKSDPGHFYIYGPASVEVIDKEKDRIRASALEVSLPQLLRRGRLSLSHQDIIVGEILPELAVGDRQYKTAVFKDRLMVLGDVWDDTEASQETRKRIQNKELKSYSISGHIRKGGSASVCDSSGCYRDVFKLDSHAVTICEEGMNPAAKFEVLQKEEQVIQYIPIATPDNNHIASPMEAEVQKNMTEDTKTKPPETEAKKEDVVPPAAGAGGGGMESKLDQVIAMLGKLVGAMGGGAGDVAVAQKAAVDTKPPAAPITKEEIAALVDEKVKKSLEEILKGAKIVQTPRPDKLSKEEMEGNPFYKIAQDPSLLDKMSFQELSELTGRAKI